MFRAYSLSFVLCAVLTAQSADAPPKFEIADIHPSAKPASMMERFFRGARIRPGRSELRNATIIDLIRTAYGYQPDKIVGGPSWLEMDRFDVIAKLPSERTTPDEQKEMLKALLEDRFKLVVHKEDRPLPTYALTAGKKLQIREGDGSDQTGCKVAESTGPPEQGGIRLFTSGADGKPMQINLGPGGNIQFHCRNITMAAFAGGLQSMMGARGNLGENPILDETGLKGAWSFDVKWSMGIIGPMMDQSERISVSDAIEKQLGLKLERREVPTPVLVVESVKRQPTDNSPDVAKILPPLQPPTEFEVADVKASNPDGGPGRGPMVMMGVRIQPGGRISVQNTPMSFLLMNAFNVFNTDQIAGRPAWADRDRFDITAKAPASAQLTSNDNELVAPMMRALLVERFGLKYHTEERPVEAYTLLPGKPKMKRGNPDVRSSCKDNRSGSTDTIACQNVTVAYFLEQLQGRGPGLNFPIQDATGLEGNWDISITYNLRTMFAGMGPGRGAGGGPADPNNVVPTGPDPEGGYTLAEAIEKQLGLKLEQRKRPVPVIVIDHLNETPSEN